MSGRCKTTPGLAWFHHCGAFCSSARGHAGPLTMLQQSEHLQIACDAMNFNWQNHLCLPVDETEGGCLSDTFSKATRCYGIEVLPCSTGATARRTLPASIDDSPSEVHRLRILFEMRTILQQRQQGHAGLQDAARDVLGAHSGQRRAPPLRQLRASLGQLRAPLVSQQSASHRPFVCGRWPFCMGGCTG